MLEARLSCSVVQGHINGSQSRRLASLHDIVRGSIFLYEHVCYLPVSTNGSESIETVNKTFIVQFAQETPSDCVLIPEMICHLSEVLVKDISCPIGEVYDHFKQIPPC